MDLNDIYRKCENAERLSSDEALALAQHGDFLKLAALADSRARAQTGNRVSYLIDSNINYTNVCKVICRFCAFYRPKGHKEAYELSRVQLDAKIKSTLEQGGTQILMQGGVHPDYTIEWYEDLLTHIKSNHNIHIHAFSPPEIDNIAKLSHLSLEETLTRLKNAGLQSIPGGGAEILIDEVRERLAIGKCNSQEWLDVMETAHRVGLKTTATMMFGHVETWKDRIEHMRKLREVQDRTEGFISFIPWNFQADNTALNPRLNKNIDVSLSTASEYLRVMAISRLFLDNFKHFQVSTLTQGIKVAQMALNFGADDMGSVMLEEQVVTLAGCDGALQLDPPKMIVAIAEAGFTPYQRDTFYNEIHPKKTQQILRSLKLRYASVA